MVELDSGWQGDSGTGGHGPGRREEENERETDPNVVAKLSMEIRAEEGGDSGPTVSLETRITTRSFRPISCALIDHPIVTIGPRRVLTGYRP
jgi:hypothetical protein